MTGEKKPRKVSVTEPASVCPQCGSQRHEGQTCQDDFYQMLAWENETPAYGDVHHLSVLCYHLQHPGIYSPEGLDGAKGLLVNFVEGGLSPAGVRRRMQNRVASGRRSYKITARPGHSGAYTHPVRWTVTARDVVAAGPEVYRQSVRAWARAVLQDLRASENL